MGEKKVKQNRLSTFLSYEWIIMIVCAVIAVVMLELVYSVAAVRLSVGQQFTYYYDQNISSTSDSAFISLIDKDATFSYDVLEVSGQQLSSDFNVLGARTSAHDVDVLITDDSVYETVADYEKKRSNLIIDTYDIYSLEDKEGGIIYDAENYLKQFVKDGGDHLNPSDLSEEKITARFNERMKKDNRYLHGEISAAQEIARIKKLCEETAFFKKVLKYDEAHPEQSIFYSYTRYEQSYLSGKSEFKEKYENQTAARYGLNASNFSGGKYKAEDYFRFINPETQGSVIILAFDLYEFEPDLQFETISFLNGIIRNFTDLSEKI